MKLDDAKAEQILAFWLGDLNGPYGFDDKAAPRWFTKDPAFDEEVRRRFGDLIEAAQEGTLEEEKPSPRTRLAHILLLDQLSRNAWRDSPRMYAGDERALSLTKDAFASGAHEALRVMERMFLCMPLMHSEELSDQQECVRRFAELEEELPAQVRASAVGKTISNGLRYAEMHRDIVERFGRFPHRNEILGRQTTAAELEFLQRPGSSF